MADVQISDLAIVAELTNVNDLIHIKSAADNVDRAIRWDDFTLSPNDPLRSALEGIGAVAYDNVVPIIRGGTGATSASAARTALGLGALATLSGTTYTRNFLGASSASAARTILELGASNNVTFTSVTANSFNSTTSSDSRLKKSVRPVGINWELYDELDFVTGLYNSLAKDELQGSRFFGVIAQDAIKVFPWCCGEDEDGYLYVDYPKLAFAIAMAEKHYPITRKLFVRPFKKLLKYLKIK